MIYWLQGTQDRSTKQTYEENVRIWTASKEVKVPIFLEFLGHLISKEGVKPTEGRIKRVQEAQPPTNKQELQSFLGMVTNFCHHCLTYVLHQLHQLLKKNAKWSWNLKHVEALHTVKKMICEDNMLVHYDINKPLKVFCDASPKGLGDCWVHAIPSGDKRLVAYASRSLSSGEQNYAQIEREALAIIFTFRRFHQYLYGRTFTLVTDHWSLYKILGEKEDIPPLAVARMQRWALLLSAY